MGKMEPLDRDVFLKHCVEDMSLLQISLLFGMTSAGAEAALVRAFMVLDREIGPDDLC